VAKKRIRVLIVEDDEATAFMIQAAFSAKGQFVDWDLCFAPDGQQALDRIFQKGTHSDDPLPEFVILDWNLPKVSGKEVLLQLKSHTDLRALPVLVFSTSNAEYDVNEAYNSHANGYISKPSGLDELLAIVENIETFWVHTARLPSRKPAGNPNTTL